MSQITIRENLEDTPLSSVQPRSESAVSRVVTLAKCLRCGFEWLPRVENPAQCARCRSGLWNVPRAQQLPGKPAPTRKGKPRGRALVPGDPRHSSKTRKSRTLSVEDDQTDASPQNDS